MELFEDNRVLEYGRPTARVPKSSDQSHPTAEMLTDVLKYCHSLCKHNIRVLYTQKCQSGPVAQGFSKKNWGTFDKNMNLVSLEISAKWLKMVNFVPLSVFLCTGRFSEGTWDVTACDLLVCETIWNKPTALDRFSTYTFPLKSAHQPRPTADTHFFFFF